MTTKEKFIEMAKNITRPGIDEMMAWLETTDFYVAPASTKFHGAQADGLCAHSITVAKRLVELANFYVPGKYTMDELMTVSLFHDVCKISTYQVEMRNRKNSVGAWEQVPFYQFAPKESVGGDNHGSLSCQRITEHGIRLTQEEYGAVNNHMGVTNPANANGVWQCYEMYTLSWLLHVADEAATVIDKI